jgi:Mlc titration factor MtfA (ptsG expression regulator)
MSGEFLRQELTRSGGRLAAKLTAGDPAEVFAAATELFFEMPDRLMQQHPEFYEMLRSFYQLDPVRWLKR